MAFGGRLFFCALFISIFLTSYAATYRELTIENDRICSPSGDKRTLRLGYNERSALALQETRYFNYWPGTYEFKCRFELEAISKDGIIAIIQNLSLRKNTTSGECIDYIQFLPKQGSPSAQLCGTMNSPQVSIDPNKPILASNAFIDVKGDLEVRIYVKKQPLEKHESIDIDIVFTAFKLCSKNPIDYKSCGREVCIWKNYFDDGRVNCPLDDCKDEISCAVSFKGTLKNEKKNNPWYMAIILIICCLVFLCLCACIVFRHRNRASRPQSTEGATDLEQHLAPSCPPVPESPKDKPPPYESLFPNQ